jgi:hypothetical protein
MLLFMLSVSFMLNAVVPSVIMLSVIMLSVVVPIIKISKGRLLVFIARRVVQKQTH